MTTKSLSATEAKNRFGRLLREIALSGGPIIIERDSKPVAVILSIEAYEQAFLRQPPTEEQRQQLQDSFGMWANRSDIDDDWLKDGRSRWESDWQDG